MPIGKKRLGNVFECNDEFHRILFFSLILYVRWVRFEEIAENVLGRWSKPHVATLMQSALLDLKNLLQEGVILLNPTASDLPTISRNFALYVMSTVLISTCLSFRSYCSVNG